MADGYEVDVDAMNAAAAAAERIAADAGPLAGQVGTALGHVSAGASGTGTEAAAKSAAGQWPTALERQVGQVGDVGEKLTSSAKDYLSRDTTAATALTKFAPESPKAGTTGRIDALLSGE